MRPSQSKCNWRCQAQFCAKKNTKKCRGPRARHRLFVRACAVENALGNVTRATLCENLQIECRGPRARHRLCSSLRNRNAFRKCGNVTRAAWCRRAKPATQTLRGPAQSKCTWKCHKSHFVRKFTGKMPPSWSTLIKHRPLLFP